MGGRGGGCGGILNPDNYSKISNKFESLPFFCVLPTLQQFLTFKKESYEEIETTDHFLGIIEKYFNSE